VTTTVEATFDENMDTLSVETALELRDTMTWALVPGAFSWVADTVIFTPSASLSPGTGYQTNITTVATDDSDPGNTIAAQYEWMFTTEILNTPPSILISTPAGGESWSGGSVHDIVFTASDSEDTPANLLVWLNYSITGGAPWTPIPGAQSIAGDASPFGWTLPLVDSVTVAVEGVVADTGGLSSNTVSALFEIDSTAPSVTSTTPLDLDVNVPVTTTVEATFDENMDTMSVESAFELRDTATWTLVPGAFSWIADTVIFTPSGSLNSGTQYQTNITTAAQDDSDPGNTIASQYEWTFTTEILNTPPSILISTPAGGESWSGGTLHDIAFTASDSEDTPANLLVWLNSSATGGAPWTPIPGAQATAGDTSPFGWTLPLVDSTTVVVNASVVDTGGLLMWTVSGMFEIDSTPPTVSSTSPLNGASGVPLGTNIIATWSESMNTDQTNGSFTLSDNLTWTPQSGVISWAGDTFVFNPDLNLNTNEWYTANFTTAAADDSDPGNALLVTYSWSFQTAALVDNNPPSILDVLVDPTPQEVFFAVNISANVTDDVGVGVVSVQITDPLAGTTTTPMMYDPVTLRYYLQQSYSIVGTYDFNITATDTSNNINWSLGQFVMQDTTPPGILHTPLVSEPEGIPIDITATVTDNYALSPIDPVWLNYTDVLGIASNVTMNPVGGDDYSQQIPAQPVPGTVTYFIWAVDSSGNPAMTPTFTITIWDVDTDPPSILNVLVDPTPQEVFFAVNISTEVVDDFAVSMVSIEVTDPLAGSTTSPMTFDPVSLRYYLEQPYSIVGTYDFNITVTDTSSNVNWSVGQFVMQDTTPPDIVHTPLASEFEGIPIDITATVTDNYALEPVNPVWLNYTDVLGSAFNVTMNPIGGDDYGQQIPAQPSPGTVSYFIWAVDAEGNPAMTLTYITAILAVDSQPPEILNVQATPSPQEVFSSVNISASITDPSGVDTAAVEITWPDLSVTNQTLVPAPGDIYYLEQTYNLVGTYPYTVWTSDTNGFWNTSSGSFVIQDSAPPLITHTPVTSELTGVPIDISATVTDNYQLTDVRIDYIDVSLSAFNVSMNWVAGDSYTYQIPAQATTGTVTYLIWAIDSSGNAALTAQYDIVISSPPDNEPPVADAGPDQLGNPEGTAVQFNGTGSTDNVGIVSYRWNFAYGPNVITLEGAAPVFTFMDVGNYAVTLNVTDAAGLYDTDTMQVSVLDSTPPEILAVSPTDGATDISTGTDYAIVFSEAMDTAETVQAISIQDVTIESFQWSSGDTRLVLTLSGLAEDKEYTVSISGATDAAGNPLPSESFTFTTMEAPSQPPSISLEQDWWWIVLIITLIVIILMLVLRKARPEAREPVLYEPLEPEPPMEPEETSEMVPEDAPEDLDIPPDEGHPE
jgi:hypothetical protein